MRLHREVIGRGPDLLLLHGWGLHGGVWSTVRDRLAATHRVHTIDLPGHGRSPGEAGWDLPTLADRLLELMPACSTWVGWSLGGLIALTAAAKQPGRIDRLVLVSSTPRFVAGPGWPCGIAPDVLDDFAGSLERDYVGTITRFLSLQLGEGGLERTALRRLRAELFRFGDPDLASLRAGLALLRQTDLRTELSRIDVPAAVIHGGRDRLVPPTAGDRLARMLPRAEQHGFPLAGHAPFLTEPDAFVRLCRPTNR